MTKGDAKQKIMSYLRERNIHIHEFLSQGTGTIVIALSGYDNCPDSTVECNFAFWDSCMEARIYFTETASRWIADRPEKLSAIYRLLNYIQARVWSFNHDGIGGHLYLPHHLVTPRFYITEDGNNDLTSTVVVDYDIFEMAPLEILDTITATLPSFMNALSIPLLFVLLDKMTIDQGISYIKREILKDAD